MESSHNKVFNLTYLGVTVLASATTAPLKTQVKTLLCGPFGPWLGGLFSREAFQLEIVRFDQITESQYLSYIQEWEVSGEKIVPMSSDRRQRAFSEMQKKWYDDETELAVDRGFVPSTVYFARDHDGQIVGCLSFRHRLNDRLLLNGGHIGYGIRPSLRRQGFGKILLKKFLWSKFPGACTEFLVTCDETNEASQKLIEACGGKLQDKFLYGGEWTRRYWIKLEELTNRDNSQ